MRCIPFGWAQARKEAREKLQQGLRAEAGGALHVPARSTVSTFSDQWLENAVKPAVRPTTHRSYEGIARVHLVLGHHQLTRLTLQHVQALLEAKTVSGLAPRAWRPTARC